jgi:hypothetical protein
VDAVTALQHQPHVEAAWNHARQFVGNCNTAAGGR